MKKFLSTLALLSFLLPSVAQAGFFSKEEWENEDCPKKHSLAWCLTDYNGRSKGIHDMSGTEFVAALKQAGADESGFGEALHSTVGVGLSAANFLMGNLLGGGVFLLSATSPDKATMNRTQQQMTFLIRNEQNLSEKELQDYCMDILFNAASQAMATLPKDVKITTVKDRRIYRIETPSDTCDKPLVCELHTGGANQCRLEKRENTPSYLGAGTYHSTHLGGLGGFRIPTLKGMNRALFAKTVSENLPDWVYWYIPAGYLGTNPMPFVFNKGKALFFVKPENGDETPVLPHLATRQENAVPAGDAATGVSEAAAPESGEAVTDNGAETDKNEAGEAAATSADPAIIAAGEPDHAVE